jgi:hypothetical protein
LEESKAIYEKNEKLLYEGKEFSEYLRGLKNESEKDLTKFMRKF